MKQPAHLSDITFGQILDTLAAPALTKAGITDQMIEGGFFGRERYTDPAVGDTVGIPLSFIRVFDLDADGKKQPYQVTRDGVEYTYFKKKNKAGRHVHPSLYMVPDGVPLPTDTGFGLKHAEHAGAFAVVGEVDDRPLDEQWQTVQQLEEADLAPHLVVYSGGKSLHLWWFLSELATDPATFAACASAIADRIGGDYAVCNINHRFRLPNYRTDERDQPLMRYSPFTPCLTVEALQTAFTSSPLPVVTTNVAVKQKRSRRTRGVSGNTPVRVGGFDTFRLCERQHVDAYRHFLSLEGDNTHYNLTPEGQVIEGRSEVGRRVEFYNDRLCVTDFTAQVRFVFNPPKQVVKPVTTTPITLPVCLQSVTASTADLPRDHSRRQYIAPDSFRGMRGIHGVIAGLGEGKTHAAKALTDGLQAQGFRAILVSPTIALSVHLSERFGVSHYSEHEGEIKGSVVVTAKSLKRVEAVIDGAYGRRKTPPTVLILDEVEEILGQFNTLYEGTEGLHASHRLANTIRTADVAVLLDAHLGLRTAAFFKAHNLRFDCVHTGRTSDRITLQATQRDTLEAQIGAAIESGESVAVACGAKADAKKLHRIYAQQVKTLLIDSDTTAVNPDLINQLHDTSNRLILFTQTMGSGVSVNHQIDRLFVITCAHTMSVNTVKQMTGRFRRIKHRAVMISGSAHKPDPEAMSPDTYFKACIASRKLTGICLSRAQKGNPCADFVALIDLSVIGTEHLHLMSRFKAISHKQGQGWVYRALIGSAAAEATTGTEARQAALQSAATRATQAAGSEASRAVRLDRILDVLESTASDDALRLDLDNQRECELIVQTRGSTAILQAAALVQMVGIKHHPTDSMIDFNRDERRRAVEEITTQSGARRTRRRAAYILHSMGSIGEVVLNNRDVRAYAFHDRSNLAAMGLTIAAGLDRLKWDLSGLDDFCRWARLKPIRFRFKCLGMPVLTRDRLKHRRRFVTDWLRFVGFEATATRTKAAGKTVRTYRVSEGTRVFAAKMSRQMVLRWLRDSHHPEAMALWAVDSRVRPMDNSDHHNSDSGILTL